ncbi:MAG TPA: hypothetical protein VF756_09310 [Thermoanaerobaculia bacterium]
MTYAGSRSVPRPVLPSLLGLAILWLLASPLSAIPARDVLGAAHAAGKYNFTDRDFLNEGADALLEMGTRVIKVWFDPNSTPLYPFNSDWGPVPETLAELAQKPYYQDLFAKPFTTYILVVVRRDVIANFIDGMTREEIGEERQQMYDLARYLLATYGGTGKTFVLQNWEGDHLLRRGLAPEDEPDPVRVRGMIDWWNARQRGVTQARRDVRARGVTVAHAAEVNLLRAAMQGRVTATNSVVPFTQADLYSYSSWDIGYDRALLTQALDYLAAKAPDSQLYGRRNLYLGELGIAKDQVGDGRQKARVIRGLMEAALGWGARYAIYWQLYCNEPLREYEGRPTNDDMRGFWLIRPDGSRTRTWTDLSRQFRTSVRRVTLRSASGRYLTAENGGGGSLWTADRRPTDWSTFTLQDQDGGSLRSGDEIRLLSHNGMYLSQADAGGYVYANRQEAGEPETFVIRRIGARDRAEIGPRTPFAIETSNGLYLSPDPQGALRAQAVRIGPAETFHLSFADEAP